MGKKQIRISNELVMNVLSEGWSTGGRAVRCTEGLPEGATLTNVYLVLRGQHTPPDLALVFEHADWEETTDPLVELPYITPWYQTEAIQEEC